MVACLVVRWMLGSLVGWLGRLALCLVGWLVGRLWFGQLVGSLVG